MMAILSDAELIYIRRKVGSAPADYVVFETYDRLLNVDNVILEILEIRYADLVRNPSSFSIPGEYSQSTDANIKALADQLADLGAGAAGPVTFVPPPARPSR